MRYHRRIQKIGSSMLISLPKSWILKHRLDKGSVLTLDVNNHILIYSPTEKGNEIIIEYPPLHQNLISKEITGAYLSGYDIISIKGNVPISYNDREVIKLTIGKLVGLEIIEEDSYNIKSQFLLDSTNLDPKKILQRINGILIGMYKDTIKNFIERNDSILRIISVRDEEINRQYFLLVRFLRSSLVDPTLAERLNLSSIDILDYRLAASLLESVGDSIVELAQIIVNTKEEIPKEVIAIAIAIEKLQSLAMNAFLNNNLPYSIQVINEYNSINDAIKKVKIQNNISTLNVLYILDRIARIWVDVADLVKTTNKSL